MADERVDEQAGKKEERKGKLRKTADVILYPLRIVVMVFSCIIIGILAGAAVLSAGGLLIVLIAGVAVIAAILAGGIIAFLIALASGALGIIVGLIAAPFVGFYLAGAYLFAIHPVLIAIPIVFFAWLSYSLGKYLDKWAKKKAEEEIFK